MKIKLLINIFILIALNSNSFAASFDCAKAVSRIENAICASPELSDLDSQLANAYKSAISRSDDIDGVKAAQRAWLKETRNSCDNLNCLLSVYKQRIAALTTSKNPAENTQEKIESFNPSNQKLINTDQTETIATKKQSVDQDISKTEITEEDLINEEAAAEADWERRKAEESAAALAKKIAEEEAAAAELSKKRSEEAATAAAELARKKLKEEEDIAEAKKQSDDAELKELITKIIRASIKSLIIIIAISVAYLYRGLIIENAAKYKNLYREKQNKIKTTDVEKNSKNSPKEIAIQKIEPTEIRFEKYPIEIAFYAILALSIFSMNSDFLRGDAITEKIFVSILVIFYMFMSITIGSIVHWMSFKVVGMGEKTPNHRIRRKISCAAYIIFSLIYFFVFLQASFVSLASILVNPASTPAIAMNFIKIIILSTPFILYGSIILGTKIFIKNITWINSAKTSGLYGLIAGAPFILLFAYIIQQNK